MTPSPVYKIAILGGTGKEGKGLAYRWALAGHDVVIGSRQLEKAQAAVEEIKTLLPQRQNWSRIERNCCPIPGDHRTNRTICGSRRPCWSRSNLLWRENFSSMLLFPWSRQKSQRFKSQPLAAQPLRL